MKKEIKKETGHERHMILKRLGLCRACGKRKAVPKPGGGTYNECKPCRAYYRAWEKAHRKAS